MKKEDIKQAINYGEIRINVGRYYLILKRIIILICDIKEAFLIKHILKERNKLKKTIEKLDDLLLSIEREFCNRTDR